MSDTGIGVFPRVKIYNTGVTTANIEINGHIMRGVKSIMYSASANGLPEFCFETYGIPDIEIDNASVYLDCQPENLAEAVRILRSAIKNDDSMYGAWVASVESWLEQTHEVTRSGLARAFVDWLAGDDVPVGNDDHAGDDVPDGHDVEDPDDVLP
jgi:hypothetical protein